MTHQDFDKDRIVIAGSISSYDYESPLRFTHNDMVCRPMYMSSAIWRNDLGGMVYMASTRSTWLVQNRLTVIRHWFNPRFRLYLRYERGGVSNERE